MAAELVLTSANRAPCKRVSPFSLYQKLGRQILQISHDFWGPGLSSRLGVYGLLDSWMQLEIGFGAEVVYTPTIAGQVMLQFEE